MKINVIAKHDVEISWKEKQTSKQTVKNIGDKVTEFI